MPTFVRLPPVPANTPEKFVTALMQLSSGVKYEFAGVDTASRGIKLTYKSRPVGIIRVQDGTMVWDMVGAFGSAKTSYFKKIEG